MPARLQRPDSGYGQACGGEEGAVLACGTLPSPHLHQHHQVEAVRVPAGPSGGPLAVVAFPGAMPTMTLSVVLAERYRLDARLAGLTLALDTALAFALLPLLLLALRTAAAG
jgi:hypothetical protein